MMMIRRTLFVALALLGASLGARSAQAGPLLDLALVIDGSGSISTSEFNLQRQAYANAFESTAIQDLIVAAGPLGGLRITAIVFATTARVEIDWTTLIDTSGANAFASELRTLSRSGLGGSTGIARGMQLANQQLALLNDPAGRRIIDVSGDGQENVSGNAAVQAARDAALNTLAVDQINGLVIGTASLETYYLNNVTGGTGSFVARVNDFDSFGTAINRKLAIELGSVVPEPSTLLLSTAGLTMAGLVGLRRRRLRGAL